MGLPELRALTAQNLQQELSIVANPAQLMLTHGASQALDLAVRTLVRPGDVVLVDDPGYPNLMSILRFQGATLIGVPRTPAGYDLDQLERLLAHHRPTAFFTQPHLHSPTCSRTPLPQLHRLLQLSSQHGFRLVENNLYADMVAEPQPCLASLDHLQQVVYVGSYSKSISPNVRVGYLVANPELMQQLLHLKMRSGLTTSQVMERVVYAAIIDGRWRKHLKRLRQRLAEAHQKLAGICTGWALSCSSSPMKACTSGPATRPCPTAPRCWTMPWSKASCSGLGSYSWSMPRRPAGCASTWRSVPIRRCGSCWRRCWSSMCAEAVSDITRESVISAARNRPSRSSDPI